MEKIKFIILNHHTIELAEDAKKGDIIDLSNAQSVDLTIILDQINKTKDEVYAKKIKENNQILEAKFNSDLESKLKDQSLKFEQEKKEKDIEIENLKVQINEINKTIEEKLKAKEIEINLKNENYIKNLKDQILSFNEELKKQEDDLQQKHETEIAKLTLSFSEEKTDLKDQLKDAINKLETINLKHKNELITNSQEKDSQIKSLTHENEQLKREKLSKNIKIIGEELENYCLNEFNNVSTYAFKTSTFEKDNIAIRNDNDLKATKGDFIFKVYAEEEKENLLLSAMCEMKSELLNSENKKKNNDHYKKLNDDREKKNLDYALLVSELEYQNTDWLIYRVQEYKNMFVIRPPYFTIMLGVLETIALKYKDLKLNKINQELSLKEKTQILNEFEEFKNNLLNNALKNIDNHVKNIRNSAEKIQTEASKILESTRVIVESHLKTVENKINDFKIESLAKKVEKIKE
ncbi:Hypothetical protein MAU_4120 [Metamycoplasma auris 15026]|uniref:DUF2130 domain-containing protein n=1 Tax=Metamycoplasma auris 15026 TaxID=1188233 RepID=N9VAB7_9BACT|nr:DUF2130 domain-containing protein [Metamycoplasma auris]ENY68623.1 Hypothetical protein MAU_4120 [Metamycoplasma auris 15026]